MAGRQLVLRGRSVFATLVAHIDVAGQGNTHFAANFAEVPDHIFGVGPVFFTLFCGHMRNRIHA